MYAVLNSDATSETQRKLNKMLLDLKKADKISDSTYKMLYSSDGFCSRYFSEGCIEQCLSNDLVIQPEPSDIEVAILF